MKKQTKDALERAADHLKEEASHWRGDDAEPMTFIAGVGTPRADMTLTRASSGELGLARGWSVAEILSEAELRKVASRLQRMEGPRGEHIKKFVIGMYLSFDGAEEDPRDPLPDHRPHYASVGGKITPVED